MAGDAINWMVPLRRAVIKEAISYRDFLQAWLEQLRDTDNSFILGVWYTNPKGKAFSPADYNRGVGALRRWLQVTFDGRAEVLTSSVGITTIQTHVPNFHARLWKGPKRVLLEQRAKDDPEQLAELRPFDLKGGRIELQRDERGEPKDVPLYPGDVLEIALHELLAACGQADYADVEFDPMGSFYLGTTVKSKSGRARVELPPLHDNMLAMRFQLVTALAMANCYHDEPVYTDKMSYSMGSIPPEGAGVFARGMPYGGNPVQNLESAGPHWKITLNNTNRPEIDRPIYLPTAFDLTKLEANLPSTWSWTCSPYALFLLSFMLDGHQTKSGLLLPSLFRAGSVARSLCLLSSEKDNAKTLAAVTDFQTSNGDDPLLLHDLEISDIRLPREQPPYADFCEILLPEDRPVPPGRPFTDADRIKRLPLPAPKSVNTYAWDELCPDAGIIITTSEQGHEFSLVKLCKADEILQNAKDTIAKHGAEHVRLPVSGRTAAYNPLSGEDYCATGPSDGQFFVTESAGSLPPTGRAGYTNLQLHGIRVHKFEPVPAKEVSFRLTEIKGKDTKKKTPAVYELQIDEDGDGKFRDKQFSGAFYIRTGTEGTSDPRTLSNIHGRRRDQWIPLALQFPSSKVDKALTKFLADYPRLYAERAVPFPTILEVAGGFPSRERVAEQLANHRQRLEMLGEKDAAQKVEQELATATLAADKQRLQKDLAFLELDEEGKRKYETLRQALLTLVTDDGSESDQGED